VTTLRNVVVALFERLEEIAAEHDEVTDTDVREAMHLALNWYFIWAKERTRFPRSFGMFSAEGDRLVADALVGFLDAAGVAADTSGLPVGQARLDVLQSRTGTASGMRYDEFIGHRDIPLPAQPLPADMFSPGDYEE
jgi:hypothetical protein